MILADWICFVSNCSAMVGECFYSLLRFEPQHLIMSSVDARIQFFLVRLDHDHGVSHL
jgi:hypothetical protein